jgi:hypothetical protein
MSGPIRGQGGHFGLGLWWHKKKNDVFNDGIQHLSGCCLTPSEQLFSYIMERTRYISMRR